MLLISLLVLFLIIGIISIVIEEKFYICDLFGSAITTFSGVLLFLALIALPIFRSACSYDIVEFKEVKRTIEYQRQKKDISQTERAALTNKIIECNTWLERTKKFSKSKWIGIYYQSEVNELEPLE
ncbi:hypothetical protein [Clostridium baratii]|uniref:hypothetical protein n=1 Tax=Clostridium baratii TaxID=1561 RepID=UPI0030D2A337